MQPALPGRDARPFLSSALSVAELGLRESRPPDYAAENRALIALARELAAAPENILQKLADTALQMCRAHSAGLSLLEDEDQHKNFHWRAIAGVWAFHRNGGTPRDFGPCGVVLDRNVPLLFSHPERDFPYFGKVTPLLHEGLLIPFYIKGRAVGTIWVVSHDETRNFDGEDLRVICNLAGFAGAAYQTVLSLHECAKSAAIVDSSDDAIISNNIDGIITTWNPAATRLFGYFPEEMIGRPIKTLIPLDRQDEERAITDRILRGNRMDHYETIRRRKDGSIVPVSLMVSPIRDAAGKIVGAVKIARNISERKQKEDHIALLSREVHHRSRNMLALVQATVRLAKADSMEALKTTIEGRVQAIANVHALLTKSRWTGAELRNIATDELSPYFVGSDKRVDILGPQMLLKPDSAQAIAIALHELTTNSVKYGALSVAAGHVRVEWWRDVDERLIILWTETNGPPVEAPSHQGFGTMVIEQIIEGELNGRVLFDWQPQGLICQLSADLASNR